MGTSHTLELRVFLHLRLRSNLAAMSSTRVVSGRRTGFRQRCVMLATCVYQRLYMCTM